MSAELQHFLWLIGLAGLGGLILGMILRRYFPRTTQEFAQASRKIRWYWFGLFGVVFTLLALGNWSEIHCALLFAVLAVLEFCAMVYALIGQCRSLPSVD